MTELSLTGLRVVREIARRGSLTAAAAHLGYTQSAVSRQLALVERALGTPLFDRHARGVRPTDAGAVVARRAEALLAELEETRRELDDLRARPRARLRVGAYPTALAALVPRAIADLAAREPRIDVVLREGTSPRLAAQVAAGRLDLAVATTPHAADGAVATPLLEDPLLLAVGRSHALAARRSVDPDELRAERWIAAATEPGSTLLGAWTESSWRPRIAYVARDWTAKLGLAAAGLGVTVVPGLAVPMLAPTLAAVAIAHPAARRDTVLLTRRNAPENPLAEAFAEALRDSAERIAAEVRQRLRA